MIPKGHIFKPAEQRFLDKVSPEPNSGCWLWIGSVNSDGYGNFNLNGYSEKAHRATFMLYCGAIPATLHVLHHCDTPPCVNPQHLFLGTPKDNKTDCVSKRRHSTARGQAVPRARLSSADVIAIRARLAAGVPRKTLASEYAVSRSTINHINSGRVWGWLTETEALKPEMTAEYQPSKATV